VGSLRIARVSNLINPFHQFEIRTVLTTAHRMAANLAELKEVLVPGLVQLLREAEVNPDLDPTTFLAEFLMRHNPRHGSFKIPVVDEDLDRVASEAVEACMGDAKRKGLK
jgi:hypothetical protein